MSSDEAMNNVKKEGKMKDNTSLQTIETADVTTVADSSTITSSSTILSIHSLDSYKRLEVFQRSLGKEAREALHSMANNPYNVQIQVSSCDFIARISYDEFYRVVIASAGGILTILNSMKLHYENPKIQARGCVILGNMCTNSTVNKARICNTNGIKVIVDVMKYHSYDPQVQSSAYFALQQLTSAKAQALSLDKLKTLQVQRAFEATISDNDSTCSDQS
eukprot:CAMPEP_0172481782 /NCGR_PEP_ID=MMETSP1066-20121228/7882_1 /TAXON_ID=671091 /ORGANISM="Coscinodiscus wailesii, Strain CCMP2513" /LENGTH=219 /DNA_ID=CAMNT_0013244387 /DNA_START=125 /DNA_END=784 /DNA_ORIENTATION=+